MDILEELKKIQGKRSDSWMAARLNCSRQLWQGTRKGNIPLGDTVLKAVARNFPELKRAAVFALLNLPNRNQILVVQKTGLMNSIKSRAKRFLR